jgi:hypothetical protein
MAFQLDPRQLVHGPFVTCPNCGSNEFGIYQVGVEMYSRRCRQCWFKGSFPLPPLSRKVVYIDQFAISNMMKTLNARSPRHASAKADPFWLKLFEALERVVKLQLVVCPDSDVHHNESMVFPWYEELKRMYEQFSHGDATFDSTDDVAMRQLNKALLAWLDNKTPQYTFDPKDVVHGNLNHWREPFIISVSGGYPQMIVDGVRAFRDDVHRKINVLFGEELSTSPHKDFKYWFERERQAGGRAIVQSYELYLKRRYEIATSAVPFTYENVYQSNGLDQFRLIMEVLKARKMPEERLMLMLAAFLKSDQFKDYPASRITSLVWAAIGQAAANGQKEPPNAGTSNDIRVLTLAPYCDALFVDNGCRALWEKIPSRYRAFYKVRLFSYNTRDNFLSYLKEIEDNSEPKVIAAAREVYGEPSPFVTMYEYEDRRRQKQAAKKGDTEAD